MKGLKHYVTKLAETFQEIGQAMSGRYAPKEQRDRARAELGTLRQEHTDLSTSHVELQQASDKQKDLIGHLKTEAFNAKRTAVAGIRGILKLPICDDIALLVVDDKSNVYLSPRHSRDIIGERIKGTSLTDKFNLDLSNRGMQNIKIGSTNYLAQVTPIPLRGNLEHYAVVLTKSVGTKARDLIDGVMDYTTEHVSSLLASARDIVASGEESIRQREQQNINPETA